jgi:hypothetical protein
MRKFLKWLGILLGALLLLVIIAAPLLLGAFMRRGMFFSGGMRGLHSFGPVWLIGSGVMMLGRMLVPLLIIGLLFWLAYSLGRGAALRQNVQLAGPAGSQPAAAQPTVEPPAAAPAQPLEVSEAPLAPAAEPVCPNCGRALQPGWVACPYCGHTL